MKYFQCIEHPCDLSKYTYAVTEDLCKELGPLCGTYRILPARLFGLSYENYVAYLFKRFGKEICFPHYLGGPMFNKREDAMKMAEMLENRLVYLLENKND